MDEDVIFIPTLRQIQAKIRLWTKLLSQNFEYASVTKERTFEYADIPESTGHYWHKQQGFTEWFSSVDDFQKEVDSGAIRILRRLEELAFTEKGNAAVAAAKAYLDMTSYRRQRIEIKDEVAEMNEENLDKEIERISKMLVEKEKQNVKLSNMQ
jgi:transcription initiation factor TFIIIB Brf1 subunit/transcription initiation factor TFIIB